MSEQINKIEEKNENKETTVENNKTVENKEPTKENTETQHKEIKRKPLRCFICQKIISKEGTKFFILKAKNQGRIKKYFLCDKEIEYLGLDPKKITILTWQNKYSKINKRLLYIQKIAKEQNLTLEEEAEKHGWLVKNKEKQEKQEKLDDSNLN
ncbi:MAG: hypothetical protein QXO65_03475 [Candidatus Aenigmatarchaeota archaeon]